MFVVYRNPSGYPGRYVVREHRIGPGSVKIALEPLAVVDTLFEARGAVPPSSTVCLARDPNDDPCIVEVWL